MRTEALGYLGLNGQDFGPCYTDDFTHEQFSAAWRGPAPCPSEAEILEAYASYSTSSDEEIKKTLLKKAIEKRDNLMHHLTWQHSLAIKSGNTTASAAIEATQVSLGAMFNDSRIQTAVDGAVDPAVRIVYLEIFSALHAAHPGTYAALLAMDPL